MFIIMLHYLKPLAEVERFLAEHRAFLTAHYASGHFMLSGPQNPRTGGVIIAVAATRAEVDILVQRDPFHREGIARYEIIEFSPTMTAPSLAALQSV